MRILILSFFLLLFNLNAEPFDCPHHCGQWGNQSIQELEWEFVQCLYETDVIIASNEGVKLNYEPPTDNQSKWYHDISSESEERSIFLDDVQYCDAWWGSRGFYWRLKHFELGRIFLRYLCSDFWTEEIDIDEEWYWGEIEEERYSFGSIIDFLNANSNLEQDVLWYINFHQSCDQKKIKDNVLKLKNHLKKLQERYRQIFDHCAKEHKAPSAYYHRALYHFEEGNSIDAAFDLQKLLSQIDLDDLDNHLVSNLCLSKGKAESEIGLYDNAIASLSTAISKNPQNKDAYFERSIAYFEEGDFSKALADYLESGYKPTPISSKEYYSFNFAKGFLQGSLKGNVDGLKEFIPSTLASISGLGHGLWNFASNPEQVSKELLSSCEECFEFLKHHLNLETVKELIPELKELLTRWDWLWSDEKGEKVGYIIGKYGVDIFASVGVIKGVRVFRNLKKANAILTLERCAQSEAELQTIVKQSTIHTKTCQKYVKNESTKLLEGHQGKHQLGHANYEASQNRSFLICPDPQKLANKTVGTGIKSGNKVPGTAGFKEIVDCGECIGYDVHPLTGKKTATNWIKIHYAKKGIHIVPTNPRG